MQSVLTVDQIRRTVVSFFQGKPVKKVWLFGSYARGEATERSDLDLLFSLEDGVRIGYFKLAQLALDMESVLDVPVDFVEENGLFHEIRKRVEQDRVLLYEA